ncbi:MAG TPA: ShlB/FhaC/HecB family hemolysin secretion/activation protein [Fontimonas sp.]
MSVALPPPSPPTEAELSMAADGVRAIPIEYESYRLFLLGPQLIEVDRMRRLIAQADTLSNAVRAIAQAHYDAGYLGARLRYARNGDDVFILVEAPDLASVDISAPLQSYFEDLPTGKPLRDRDFEPRRVLAALHAERAGAPAISRLAEVDGGQQLQVDLLESDERSYELSARYSNYGNRFVGRNLLDLSARKSTDDGDNANLMLTLAPTRDEDAADEYYEGSLSWSRVTPYGLFGASAHVVDYKQPAGNQRIDGDLEEYQLAWSYPLAATLSSRWILDLSVDYTDKQRSAFEDIVTLQDEQYASVQAGIDFAHDGLWGDRTWDALLGVELRHGLRDTQGESGAALDYFLYRPRGHFKIELADRLFLGAAAVAQFSSDSLPEQSQWLLGGSDAVQAYLPGVAVGDRGMLGLLELEYKSLSVGSVDLTPRLFVETGTTEFVATEAFPDGERVELSDAGMELGASWRKIIEASVSYAWPIDDSDLSAAARGRYEAGVLFRVEATF